MTELLSCLCRDGELFGSPSTTLYQLPLYQINDIGVRMRPMSISSIYMRVTSRSKIHRHAMNVVRCFKKKLLPSKLVQCNSSS